MLLPLIGAGLAGGFVADQFQKAEQERIKKEDPLQYKKYKRGDYTKEQ